MTTKTTKPHPTASLIQTAILLEQAWQAAFLARTTMRSSEWHALLCAIETAQAALPQA